MPCPSGPRLSGSARGARGGGEGGMDRDPDIFRYQSRPRQLTHYGMGYGYRDPRLFLLRTPRVTGKADGQLTRASHTPCSHMYGLATPPARISWVLA